MAKKDKLADPAADAPPGTPETPETPPDAPPETPPDPHPAVATGPKAEVLVHKAIAFDGMRIAPKTEPKGGKVLGPQRAIVPKRLVAAHGPDRVEFVKAAPADATVGPID